MKGVVWCLLLAFLFVIMACVSGTERARTEAFYDKYDKHCRIHARDLVGEVDEQARYEECMNYFVTKDENCPTCIIDPHLKSSGN